MNNDETENKIVYLRLDDILPNQFQPREVFDEAGLEELADSIKKHGIIQPVIVRSQGDKYELIAGERRCKAAALAGLTKIPAIVREMDDKESAKVSLLENLQRKNLSAIEEARTYKKILELDNMTQDDLAKTMGKSQPAIANKIRLLGLPEEVQDALIKNQISERHARSLLNVKDKEQQLKMLDRIRNERLTVRELDAEIKKIVQPINPNEISNEDITSNKMEKEDGGEKEMPHDNMLNDGMESNFNNDNNVNNINDNMNDNNVNNMNMGMVNNTPESFMSNNQFGNIPNSYGNFNNMGLNDYKGNGMFNNIPNFNNQNNQNAMSVSNFQGGFSNTSTNNFNEGSKSFIESQPNIEPQVEKPKNDESMSFNANQNNFNNTLNSDIPNSSPTQFVDMPNNDFNSLGSMFDGNTNNNQNMQQDYSNNNNYSNSNYSNNDNNNSSRFISQIKEDTIKPKENQFLPNFDTPNNFNNAQNSFNDMSNMNSFNSQNNFGMNEFSNQNQNAFGNNYNNNINNMNNQRTDFSNSGIDNFNNSTNSFPPSVNNNNNNMPSNSFYNNQGGLFNQPLNIISVPPTDRNDYQEETKEEKAEENKEEKREEVRKEEKRNFDKEKENEENTEEKANQDEMDNDTKEDFDNPLDDAYEDILNAKPVPINQENDEGNEDEQKKINEEQSEEEKENKQEKSEETENKGSEEEATELSEEVEVIGDENSKPASKEDIDSEKETVKKEDYISLDPVKTIFDARGAVYELKKTTDAIKQNDIKIDTEEIEFDDYYQITIKIKK